MKKYIKVNGFIIFLSVLTLAAFPRFFMRGNTTNSLDEVLEIFGITFILFGQIIRVSARGYKSECSHNGQALIQDGPYGLVRNPMYLGIIFIGLGIVLMLFQWWVVAMFLLYFLSQYFILIFKEEKKLLTLFPQAYPDYKNRVPRLLPSISILLNKDISYYLPLKLSWLKKEIGSIIAVLFGTLLIESWEDIRETGIRVYLQEAIGMVIVIILFIIFILYLSKKTENVSKDISS